MGSTNEKKELRIFTPIGMLGYGLSEDHLQKAIDDGVDAMIVDSGSTDSGPQKLALGKTTVPRESYERDLDLLLAGCHTHRVPLLIGSAGGDGANDHVDLFLDIIQNLISQKGYRSMKVVSIYSEIDKEIVYTSLERGDVLPCSKAVPPLKKSDVDESTRIVAQMGLEPFVKAMQEHPDFDIIVGGRAYDPSPYAAFCVFHGFDNLGIAYHMGKIMECGGLCATPKCQAAVAIVRQDSFDIVPGDPASYCTVTSVASHTMYEKTRPDILVGPGGTLFLEEATYEQLEDHRTVRVKGGKFVPADPYTVKLEGARVVGYRSAFFGGFRDPILISQVDQFLKMVEGFVRSRFQHDYELKFHQYGKNAVMGRLEPNLSEPKEMCICGEVLAPTQEQATKVCALARLACVHGPYPHQVATAGNLAMPFPPFDIPMGNVCEFCIYHILQNIDPVSHFPIRHQTIEGPGDFIPTPKKVSVGLAEAKTSFAAGNGEHTALKRQSFFKPDPPAGHRYLGELASVVRTKNAGPYELTMDVIFDNDGVFQKVKKSGILSLQVITKLYGISEDDVLACLFWDQAWAFKTTIKRPNVSGQFGDIDTHGSQQHIPLLYLPVPM
jgi:hypothetical protein